MTGEKLSPLFDIVIPTAGRPSLQDLLRALRSNPAGPKPGRIIVVDDRSHPEGPLRLRDEEGAGVVVVRSNGRGPAAARNAGWRLSSATWVTFLDDDVVPGPPWYADLAADLGALPADVAGSQGRIDVPLPTSRKPTDWERNVKGLETARWATADIAYRREVLTELGGFDERFPRAYREDADLGLRVIHSGYRIVRGERRTVHPVRPADRWVSLRLQAGNADDVLMAKLHGRRWRARVGAPRGRRPLHLATVGVGAVAIAARAAGSKRLASAAAAGWAVLTAELAWRRISPGPRDRREVTTMVLTSIPLPAVATWHYVKGLVELRARLRTQSAFTTARRTAVLLDRDGTLIEDVPYNGDPSKVEPVQGAARALQRLRSAGIPTAVITNQSGVARGLISEQDVAAVNRRVEELLGPLGPWLICNHAADSGCGCRKPEPGLVLQAAERLGVHPADCVVIGDIGADVEAASNAGAKAILVPNARTRPEEIAAANLTAPDLTTAVDYILSSCAAGVES
jgi:histidinol-phosphate phosphatase family protein